MSRSFSVLLLMSATLLAAEDATVWKKLPTLPDPLGVAAPFAGVNNGSLIVAGGANFPGGMPWEGGIKVWQDRIWLLDRPDGVWRDVAKLPRPLAYGISASTAEGIICVGGSDAERHYPDAFRLSWKDGKLVTASLPSLPIPISGACGALVNNTVYVAGGSEKPGEQSATNRLFALDLSAQNLAWRELAVLPGKPRLLAVAGVHDGAFYVFGGVALEPNDAGKLSRVYLREAWRFDLKDGWRQLADLPKPCVAAPSPAPFVSDRLLLLAGDDGSRIGFQPIDRHPGFPKDVLAYDPMRNQWGVDAGQVPAPRATVPCVQWNGMFVIPSGEVRPGVRSPEVWSITQRQ